MVEMVFVVRGLVITETDDKTYKNNLKINNFHKFAMALLSEIYQYVTNYVSQCQEVFDPALCMEAVRILASNVVIGHYFNIGTINVTEKSKLWLNQISQNHQGLESSVNTILRNVRLPEKQEIINELCELTPYQLTKLLESIHEIMVYENIEYSFENEIKQSHFNGGKNEKWLKGVFYTPSEVTEFICENTIGGFLDRWVDRISHLLNGQKEVDSNEILHEFGSVFDLSIVDPACGSGSFLIEALLVIKSRYTTIVDIYKRLKKNGIIKGENKYAKILKNDNVFLQHFQENIYGVDLDSAAIEVAAICLSIISGRKRNLKYSFNTNLKVGNSLISEMPIGLIRPAKDDIRNLLVLRNKIRSNTSRNKSILIEIYKNEVSRLQKGTLQNAKGIKRASRLFKNLHEKKAFCWELEFPEIFYKARKDIGSGFDILVMNPPYDNLKLNISEFRSEINGVDLKELKEARKRECEYFRKSGHYRLSNRGMLNYYRLMVERALNLTSASSLLGFIIPSTFLADLSASKLREEILLNYNILGIFDFLERARVFRGVNQSVCIVLIDKACKGKIVPLACNLSSLSELNRVKPIALSVRKIKDLFPADFSIPKITERGWVILEKIHQNPPLSKIQWISYLRGEVDLSLYKDCLSRADTGSMLVRGNHITRYLLKWNPDRKESFIIKDPFLKRLGNSKKVTHVNELRITGQQVSNMMQKWRMKFCLVPPGTFLGNSCNYLIISGQEERSESLRLFLLALLNSFILNWRFKLTSTNNHINNYELGSLPIKLIDWESPFEVRLFKFIVENVKQIIQAGEVIEISPKVEAAIFLLYELTPEEIRFILESGKFEQRKYKNIMKYVSILGEVVEND